MLAGPPSRLDFSETFVEPLINKALHRYSPGPRKGGREAGGREGVRRGGRRRQGAGWRWASPGLINEIRRRRVYCSLCDYKSGYLKSSGTHRGLHRAAPQKPSPPPLTPPLNQVAALLANHELAFRYGLMSHRGPDPVPVRRPTRRLLSVERSSAANGSKGFVFS